MIPDYIFSEEVTVTCLHRTRKTISHVASLFDSFFYRLSAELKGAESFIMNLNKRIVCRVETKLLGTLCFKELFVSCLCTLC